MRHADVHVVVPTEMDEALASFQSTPKLLSQNSTNDSTDTVQRQDSVVLQIERQRSGVEKPRTLPLDLQNDTVLPLDRIGGIIRRILREEFWCRLERSEGFIHFCWDYYMYVGVPHPCPTAEARAAELGLYVEEFASPIRESVREAEAESW